MNFLELVNDLRIEAGASGRDLTSVNGALLGEPNRFRKWIKDAWVDIQIQHEHWNFMWVESSFIMPVNGSVLEPPEFKVGEVAEWQINSFRIAEPGQARKDSQPLRYHEYMFFRDTIGRDITVPGKPQGLTIHRTKESIQVAPAADKAYVLFYDYWRAPQILKDDLEEPIIPQRFHNLIVFWALRKYGSNEAAPEALMRAKEEIDRLLPSLEIDQLPGVSTSGLMD